MDYKELYLKQLNMHYCTSRELQYSTTYKYFLLTKDIVGFRDYIDLIENDCENDLIRINLKSFNSKYIYFSKCLELIQLSNNLSDLLIDDLKGDKKPLAIRNMPEFIKSRIYSELEGSLNIENVPTTRKRFDELVLKNAESENINDITIKNMAYAIDFILTKPTFNKENLYKLYNILSKDLLDFNHTLKENEYYRYDDVYVDKYAGCPVEKIEECMNSLFTFVNENMEKRNFITTYLPHIAHYYILYIHPYFDYNGRTARMVSMWINLLINNNSYPPFISEAINQTKNKYYSALSESRNFNNDITYFLIYIFDISILYFLTYLNIENISKDLLNKGIIITNTEKDYLKKILISENGVFTYKDFIEWNHIEISKQGAFKILNKFIEYGILLEIPTSSNKKLFKINESIILYKTK